MQSDEDIDDPSLEWEDMNWKRCLRPEVLQDIADPSDVSLALAQTTDQTENAVLEVLGS